MWSNLKRIVTSANTGLDAIKRAPIVENDTGIKCIRIQDISQKKNYNNWGFSEVTSQNFEKFQLKKEDILIARTGGSIGVNCYIFENMQAVYNNGLIRIRVDKNNYNSKFVYYLLQTDSFKQHIYAIAFSTSAQPNMKIRHLLEFKFMDLPLKNQNKIVNILSTLDDKIELNKKINQTLESIAQTIFKSWFIDFDPVHAKANMNSEDEYNAIAKELGISREILDLFPSEFEESELGLIPMGWEVKPISEAIFVNPISKMKKGTLAKYADMKSLPTSGYCIDEVSEKEYNGGVKFVNDDVLIARITPCLENGKTGLVDFLKRDEVGFGSTEFIVLRKKGAIKKEFIACLSRLSSFRKHCEKNMTGTSGRQRVQNSCFSNFFLAFPKEPSILDAFHHYLNPIFCLMSSNHKNSNILRDMLNILLPKLISGEIDVTHLNMEPEND